MMPPTGSAPIFTVPLREIVALEHPMIVKNIDNGLKTLGSGIPLQQLLSADGYEGCFPLYLRTVDPTCAPLLSNNTPSSNVLLKITVPKRTGRKRKRGSEEPYTLDAIATAQEEVESHENGYSTSLRSHSRLDNPRDLLRSLRDNVGKYLIEPVGSIDQTHRYRGMTDFHYSTSHGKFMTKFRETVLPGNVESLRKFKLDPSRGVKENEELVPPPTFSDKTIPVNWAYHQNSNIKINTYYVPFDTPTVPTSPPSLPPPDPVLQSLLTELRAALSERPIWTRRAIMNRIPRTHPGIYLLKPAIQYVGYQFRGGPWRDAIVRYGVDPRSSPEYRIYQTLFFKIVEHDDDHEPASSTGPGGGGSAVVNKPWHDRRSEYTRKANPGTLDPNSHVFDGTSISLDGKIWQVCDITDPLLARLLATSTLRDACDPRSDGWYCNGTWAKVRAVMRAKISAIRIGRELRDADFQQTLLLPDDVKDKARVTAYMPNLGLAAVADAGDDDDDDADADGGSDAGGLGGGRVVRAVGVATRGKAWRERKSRGIKKRNRKRADGTSHMGFGKARVTKGVADAMNASPSVEVRESGGRQTATASGGRDVGAHLAGIGADSWDGAVENADRGGVFRAVGEEGDGEDDGEGEEKGYEDEEVLEGGEDDGEEDDGEEDDGEEDGGDEDEDEEDDDEELDGERW